MDEQEISTTTEAPAQEAEVVEAPVESAPEVSEEVMETVSEPVEELTDADSAV